MLHATSRSCHLLLGVVFVHALVGHHLEKATPSKVLDRFRNLVGKLVHEVTGDENGGVGFLRPEPCLAGHGCLGEWLGRVCRWGSLLISAKEELARRSSPGVLMLFHEAVVPRVHVQVPEVLVHSCHNPHGLNGGRLGHVVGNSAYGAKEFDPQFHCASKTQNV